MADFQFYLNRQGVRGAKGVKGDKGDSPIVSVNKHTANEYVLQIDNPDGTQIITPNLVGQQIVVNTAGDYVKYDRGSNQFVTVELPSATGVEEGLIRLATDADYTARDEFSAVTPYGLVQNLPSLITTSVDNLIRVFYDAPTDSIVIDTSKIHEDISGVNTTATNALNISRDNTNEINALKSTAISIDDTTITNNKVWSSSKTNSEISTVANSLLQTQGDVTALNADMTEIKPIVQGHTASISSINDSISNLMGKTNPATTTTAGIVKPDGKTITITDDGTISAVGGGGVTINDSATTTTSVWSSSKTNSEITTVANEVVQVQGDVASLNGDVSTLKTDVSGLNTDVPALKTDVSTLKADVSGLKTDVSGLKTSKQNTLVSGTNIKTINGETILGEGDITVGGSTPANMVTTDTTQTIFATKRFYGDNTLSFGDEYTNRLIINQHQIDCYSNDGSTPNMTLDFSTCTLRVPSKVDDFTFNFYSNNSVSPIKFYHSSGTYDILHTGNLIPSENLSISNADTDGKHTIDVSQALLNRIAALEATVASLQTQIGEIAAKLDTINGEAI